MPKQIYELGWLVGCCGFEFTKTEWRVFGSEDEARAYSLRRQGELNDGLPPDQKAWDGYYYRLWCVRPAHEIDGYRISLEPLINARGE